MYPSLTSDRTGATSNLALKAILGIYAMGKINQALEVRGADSAKTNHYLVSCLQYLLSNLLNSTTMQSTASNYAKKWETLAFTTNHITTSYGSEASWGLVYNLYAPRLLGTNIISEKVSILRDRENHCITSERRYTKHKQHGMIVRARKVNYIFW